MTSIWALLGFLHFARANQQCRNLPGDHAWPSQADWNQFNSSIDGKLIATTPLASMCHAPNYNASICDGFRQNWVEPVQHYGDPSSIMAPFFTNGSCDPFHDPSDPCRLGNFAVYSVEVETPVHISQTIDFAIKRNIRLVVKNTGHDYLGKSTGAGSLSLWTHNLKGIKVLDYESNYYRGKALKIGAGVQGFEAYQAAHENGLQVVGGECPTVGIAGGYTQGGGHSALASKYGLAADQTLEWEVVDGTGKLRTASRDQNSDLYWALSGGGAGTYGVVWSLTLKAHPDIPVSSANLSFSNEGITQDTFYEAVQAFHTTLPSLVDVGAMSIEFVTNASFSMSPLTAPGVPLEDLTALLKPFTNTLDKLKIPFRMYTKQFPGYLEQFNQMQSPIQVGVAQYGGRLLPRSVIEEHNDELTQVIRYITSNGANFTGVGLNVAKAHIGDICNAVLPAWRDTLIDSVLTTPWNFTAPIEEMIALQDKMTNDYIPRLEAISPGSGVYMNEADFRQPNFQQAFFGENYERLRDIKRKYDPHSVFYALTAVGSDEWIVTDEGRLCRI